MKILITTDVLSSIRDNEDNRRVWNVDGIMSWGSDIDDSLLNLPEYSGNITFLVPTIINVNNALAYDGVNLALRILFNYLIKRNNGIGIVLLGFESQEAFLLHYSYPNILKIPGISYHLFNQKEVSCLIEHPTMERLRYKSYIENLGLVLPTSFKSTHSLTNEWSIYKWAAYMGFNSFSWDNLPGLLYFDYIKVIEKINGVTQKTLANNTTLQTNIQSLKTISSKILLIDDNEGWHLFFREFFENAKIQFEAIGHDFKKKTFEEISQLISKKIETFRPDVILLDFRLLEDSDADSDFKKISGVKILKDLKGTFHTPGNSFGRQILIFTATSRIENIFRLKKLNADGFILKEKPEQYGTKEITKNLIVKMVRDIKNAVSRAKFLIPLNKKLSDLESLISTPDVKAKAKKEMTAAIKTITDSVRLITQNNELNEDLLKVVYLDLFRIFENIKDYSGIIEFPNEYSLNIYAKESLPVCSYGKSSIYQPSTDNWNCTPQSVQSSRHHEYCKEKSLKWAICAVILFRLGKSQVDDTPWNNIRIIRNALAHSDKGQLAKRGLNLNFETLQEYSLIMLDLISDILNPIKISTVSPPLS